MFQLPYSQEKAQSKIREEFLKNSHVRDVRAIDMLVIKSQMDLQETLLKWKQTCHMKGYFKHQTLVETPTDFMGKFLSQKHYDQSYKETGLSYYYNFFSLVMNTV